MHSCHTALSNYSTIAATQVMEFQLKYDSFRICFCSKESEWGVVFHGLRRQGSGRRGGSRTVAIFSSLYSPFSHLSTHSTPPPPHPPSKGNDLAETLFVQRHSAVRAWSQAKMGCYDKGLCVEKSKKEPLVDRLLPRTITLPAVPNRRLQEISAKKGCSAQTGGELGTSSTYMTLRGCKPFRGLSL